MWKPHLGFANIDLEIGDKKVNITVTPVQAAIIFKFQQSPEWNAQQLAASIKVPVSTLRRRITFWQSQGIIVESSPDVFSLVEDGGGKKVNADVRKIQRTASQPQARTRGRKSLKCFGFILWEC